MKYAILFVLWGLVGCGAVSGQKKTDSLIARQLTQEEIAGIKWGPIMSSMVSFTGLDWKAWVDFEDPEFRSTDSLLKYGHVTISGDTIQAIRAIAINAIKSQEKADSTERLLTAIITSMSFDGSDTSAIRNLRNAVDNYNRYRGDTVLRFNTLLQRRDYSGPSIKHM
jgi:hypothetical protein